ncbi:ABC transporter ATP-binding protein [Methanothermobacter sp.]|uniref:ABC transporter ATP-binding protein n=1 Tax=Methanothermobacter sp. TaxID=1884223 RepID=UPI003C7569AD
MVQLYAVSFEDVSYTYPNQKQHALRDVDLKIKRGESVFITGRSGSGKSTIARLITAVAPSIMGGDLRGTVMVNGRDTADLKVRDLAADVGYVFQNPESQFFTLNVNDEVSLGPENLELPDVDERVGEALRMVGLEHKRYESVFRLSDGEKQRVAIASQLSMSPGILLMDEPTSSLDRRATDDFFDVLQRMQDRTLILIDHRTYRVPDVFDRVIVMDDGCVVEDTDTDALMDPDFRDKYGLRSPDVRFGFRSTERKGKTVLRVSDLSYSYGDDFSLRGINLELREGEVLGLTGPNGSGKTTLARLISGLLKPESGFIEADGGTGLVMQDPDHQLFMDTVEGELTFGVDDYSSKDLEGVLRTMNLHHLRGRHPHSLSGGEKQRTVISAYIFRKPGVLVLDEPTTGMDLDNMKRLVRWIDKLRAGGISLMVISHDREFLEMVADNLVSMDNGNGLRWLNEEDTCSYHDK